MTNSAMVHIDGPKARERRKVVIGKSLVEFASDVGICHQYLSQIERGDRNPSPPVFARLCAALGIEDRRELLLGSDGAS